MHLQSHLFCQIAMCPFRSAFNPLMMWVLNCMRKPVQLHSCQPFRFWQNSSAFYTIFHHSDRNDQIPPKLKKFGNANTMDKDYACARRASAKYISMFLFHHAAASLHLFL